MEFDNSYLRRGGPAPSFTCAACAGRESAGLGVVYFSLDTIRNFGPCPKVAGVFSEPWTVRNFWPRPKIRRPLHGSGVSELVAEWLLQ